MEALRTLRSEIHIQPKLPELHLIEDVAEEPIYGPHVSELKYEEGGMSRLIAEASLGAGGKIRLTPDDLADPTRIGLIHYELRDKLSDGQSIDLYSNGIQKIIPSANGETNVYIAGQRAQQQ